MSINCDVLRACVYLQTLKLACAHIDNLVSNMQNRIMINFYGY
jgi:hypothetical protein